MKNETNTLTTKSILKLIVFNILLVSIIGFLNLSAFANLNSQIGGYIVATLVAYIVVTKTKDLDRNVRLLRFGTGLIFYFALILFTIGFIEGIKIGILPCIGVFLLLTYFGDVIFEKESQKEQRDIQDSFV